MKRLVALAAILASGLLAFGPAHAAPGANLTWSRCYGEGVGTQNRAFACDTNAGSEVLVVSFVLPSPLAQVSGNEFVIDLISQDDPLPTWWEFKNPGTCRQTSLSMNLFENPADVVCTDWQQGLSSGGIGSYASSQGTISLEFPTRHRRLTIALAVPLTGLQDLIEDTEYFACNIHVDHAKTVGTGACGGCAGSVCLVLNHFRATTTAIGNDVNLFGGSTPGSNMAQWQGTGADCLLVPVQNRSWGQVKALYR